MAFATLNGKQASAATVYLPASRVWTADVTVVDASTVTTGPAVIVLGDLTLKGTIYRGGDFLGSSTFRVIGGAGGWKKNIPAKFYQSSFGVKLKPVVTDAANACGETVNVITDSSLGQFFVRRQAEAQWTLYQTGKNWWVDTEGVTQIGERPTPLITSKFDVLTDGTQLSLGKIQIATDFPKDWLPGVKFVAPTLTEKQASAVVHRLTGETLRTEIWTA